MAEIKLTIHGFLKSAEGSDTDTMTLVTGTTPAQSGDYLYALVGLSMNKQIYQPTSIVADISINKAEGKGWVPIDRSDLGDMFRHCQVTLQGDNDVIGKDYYVHEVIPEYRPGTMMMRLKIYSLDNLLTLKQECRSFVGKKLVGDILEQELPKYLKPFNKGEGINKFEVGKEVKEFKAEDRIKTVRQLVYKNYREATEEHIFPYLVQYNESFYDMLARTTNRWGEFMYYEDGQLRLGYSSDEKEVKKIGKYYKLSYSNIDMNDDLLGSIGIGNYEMEAAFDKAFYDTPVQKSPNYVTGELGYFRGKGDKYAMKKIGSFLNTDKNILSWITGTLVDDAVSLIQAGVTTKSKNSGSDEKYFPKDKCTGEKYGTYSFTIYDDKKENKDGFNEFTEITSIYASKDDIYGAERYAKVLELEREAGNNMAIIDYDTTWPGFKLGNIIEIGTGDHKERFIVINISAKYVDNKLTFVVKASGAHESASNGNTVYDFYPPMLPSGHVRYSGPQVATIKDTGDPASKNRVRLVFPWHGKADDATPWVPDGEMTTCKHNKGDEVVVGFIDGNIERPYVIAAKQTKATVDLNTPGGHSMSLTDGSGGMAKFVTQAFAPVTGTLFGFIPMDKFPGLGKLLKSDDVWKKNKFFEGGFSLGDNYGIYKISGSTDKRNISISSPWGDVKIDAFTGIKISAPNGDVKISGKNVTIEAGNNLKLESGTNIGWKLGYDKKFGSDYSANSLGLTAVAAIASSLANKVKLLDLSIIRSVVEVVMRPVEGGLTVKSNRYLKLESGESACEYPKDAYNEDKKKKLLDAAAKKTASEGALKLGDGVVELFRMTDPIAKKISSEWVKLYNDCVTKKNKFDELYTDLDFLTNDDNEPCQDYGKLKAKFWDEDVKKKVEEADLDFKDNIPVTGNNIVSAECLSRNSMLNTNNVDAQFIISQRVKAKNALINCAKDLREAIVKVLDFSLTQDDVDKEFGFFRWTSLPDNSKKKMFAAISKKNCKELPFYTTRDSLKDLTDKLGGVSASTKKGARRTFCMNLLKELKLDKNRATPQGQAQPPAEPKITDLRTSNEGEILHAETWKAYVDSLQAMPAIKIDSKNFGQTIKDAFLKQFTEAKDAINFTKSYDEMNAWADGNPGGILFGANKNTYRISPKDTGEFEVIKIESLKPIETFTAAEAGKDDKEGKAIEAFMKQIKDELNSI
jgi:hypothetical protein